MTWITRPRFLAAAVVVCGLVLPAVQVDATPSGGAMPRFFVLRLPLRGEFDVPMDAVGVALNVTVTNPEAAGFLTVFPCGVRPLASNLNYVADQTVPNLVISGLDAQGRVCINTMSTTDIIVDIAGYIPAGSPMVPLAEPQRFLDTRAGVGAPTARVIGGAVLAVPVAGGFGVPGDAQTVVFNATAVQPAAQGFLTVFPCGQSIPETSTLNFTAGSIVPNLVVSAVGADGAVCFYSNVDTDIVADVAAFVPGGSAGLTTLDRPHRIVDTRIGLGGPAAQVAPAGRAVAVAGRSGVPGSATAAIVNLTATGATGGGYAAAYPCGGIVPLVSNLNFTVGANVANAAIVKLSADGTMCLTANRPVDMVVDVVGYTEGPTAFVPVLPTRVFDSREDGQPTCNMAVRAVNGVLQVVDTISGVVRPLEISPVNFGAPPTVLIDSNCHIFVLQGPMPSAPPSPPPVPGAPPAVPTTSEYDRTGHLLRTFAGPDRTAAFTTPWGLFTIRNGDAPAVIDAVSGEVLFDLPITGRTDHGDIRWWKSLGVTDDGSMFAMSVNAPVGFGKQVAYFSFTGEMLGIYAVPNASDTPLSMSPDGLYLALAAWKPMSSSFAIQVRTLDLGEVISTSPYEEHWSSYSVPWPQFRGRASLYGCVLIPGGSRATSWQVFSESLTPLSPLLPDEPCVLAAA